MSAEIKSITIKIGNEEKTLTVQEAKELQAALNGLLQAYVPYRYIPHYPQYQQPSQWPYCGQATLTASASNQALYQSSLTARDINCSQVLHQ